MHLLIRGVSDDVVGIELSPKYVERARERGVELVFGDAELVPRLGRTFDVVFSGELIEHLSCFSGLLETAREHLEPGGHLVVTTPNLVRD